MITQERLKEILDYDPDTGIFVRKKSSGGFSKGTIAGSTNQHYGYVHICIDRKMYKAHRLAFLFMEGRFPDGEVDHRNGIRDDNSWENLRKTTRGENARNCARRSDNSSGRVGVSFHKRRKQWRARIGKTHLGWFSSKEEAVQAREEAEVREGYSDRHGKEGIPYNNSFGSKHA